MLFSLLLLLFIAPAAIAVEPVVSLKYASYRGVPLPNGITQWLGMRYAASPVGPLRFAAPQDPPPVSDGVLPADQHGHVCLATGANPHNSATSEDCLFLDVFAPTGATTKSKLPVYFFIQGGGFNSLSNANYNGSGLIAAAGHEIVVVTFNYRIGPYGFIASKEIEDSPSATANNGLRDQRKALEWVQKHIAEFGGDPEHVVLGGDSAGAASIALHLTAFGGRDDKLFHGAAIESVSFAPILTVEESQYQFDNFVSRLGCAKSTTSDSQPTLSCLRSKSAVDLQRANTNIPYPDSQNAPIFMWNPVLDNDFVTSYTYDAFSKGAFLKVPVISGDDTNGGTVFTPRRTSSFRQSNAFLHDQFPYLTKEHLNRIETLYPNRNPPSFPNAGSFWRQVSNAYGDLRYMCPNLFISAAYAQHGAKDQNWNYRFNVRDRGLVREGLGVPHTLEISAIWGPENVHGAAPASFRRGGENDWIVPFIQGYWTSFIRTLNPNVHRVAGTPEWESYTSKTGTDKSAPRRFLFDTQSTSTMETVDASLQSTCQYFWSIGLDIRQ